MFSKHAREARKGRRACARGHHDWNRDLSGVGDALFYRIACRREGCGYSMDAVQYKSSLKRLSPLMRRQVERTTSLVLPD